jgi:hypothetical protein
MLDTLKQEYSYNEGNLNNEVIENDKLKSKKYSLMMENSSLKEKII